MIVVVHVLSCSLYAAVVYVYSPDAWITLSKPDPIRSDLLIVRIVLRNISYFGQLTYAIAYRLADAPSWLLNAEIAEPIVCLSVMDNIMRGSAPGSFEGASPPRNRYALGAFVGLAVLVLGLMLTTRPDMRPCIDRARPYIGDVWHTGEISAGQGPPPS